MRTAKLRDILFGMVLAHESHDERQRKTPAAGTPECVTGEWSIEEHADRRQQPND